jgi:osmotically-inducible protein OsmY
MDRRARAQRIEQEIKRQAGLSVVVEEDGGNIVLTGMVDSPQARQAAEDIVHAVVPDARIDNGLDVPDTAPLSTEGFDADLPSAIALPDEPGDILSLDPSAEDMPDFTNEVEVTPAADPDQESDVEAFFAPTDPVITADDAGNVHIRNGFAPTSDTDVTVLPSASDGQLGDEAIADAVRRELREDASTTELLLEVSVLDGSVTLWGVVQGIEDSENAEAVAGRVPGVVEVIDQTVVPGI